MVDTLKLGGIKLSGELVQIDFQESGPSSEKLIAVLSRITAAEITIPHLHQQQFPDGIHTTICIAAENFTKLAKEAETELRREKCKITSSVGTITLFPHRFSLLLCSRIVHVICRAGIPLLGISTSVSAVVIHCDYHHLDKAAEAILTEFELPENHTPLRPVVLLGDQPVETIAVYWEPKIRIYGMDVQRRLTQLCWQMPEELCSDKRWLQIGGQEEKFRLLLGQTGESAIFQGQLLMDESWRSKIVEEMDAIIAGDSRAARSSIAEVDLVSFHGPHFQDRYGIAERVLVALQKSGINLLSSGCTGTSVHLVVIAGDGDRAAGCLADVCIVPS